LPTNTARAALAHIRKAAKHYCRLSPGNALQLLTAGRRRVCGGGGGGGGQIIMEFGHVLQFAP